jgi:hypothetical protein
MTTRIKLRRDTAANWTTANPILAAGEPGLESDTGKIKYGDGETAWTSLDYNGGGGDSLSDDGSVVVTAGSTEHWIATQRRDNQNVYPKALRYDSLGNLYSLTDSYDGQDNITILTKYTAAGAIAWQKSFTGFDPHSLAIDSSDRAYITYTDGGDMSPPYIGVYKFETTGGVLWQKEYDMSVTASWDAFIEEKSATTLALVCSASDEAPGPNMIIAMEISASTGAVEIKRRIAFDALDATVFVTGLDVDPDENVFITGSHYNSADSVTNMFVEKLDQNLGRVWSKTIDVGATFSQTGGDCASDALGNIYAVGAYIVRTINSGNGTGDTDEQSAGILVKLNSSGVLQWTRRLGPGPCGSFIAGLTATATGDVYLSAATFAISTDSQTVENGQSAQEDLGDNKMIVVRYTTTGDVVWQRYVDVAHLEEIPNNLADGDSRGQAIAVFEDKFAVDGYGNTWNTTPYDEGYSHDNEYDYFVVQLPTAGTDLTIGDLHFTESRVPGRFITPETVSTPLVNIAYPETISAETVTINADAVARVANDIVNSDTYDYTFGADGTLTIPNDGDIRLTQSQVGYMMSIGSTNNLDPSVYYATLTVDADGYTYVGGEEGNGSNASITKISPTGERLWGVNIIEDSEGWENRVNGLVVNPENNSVTAILRIYTGDDWYGAVVTLDKDTGRILDNTEYKDLGSNIYLNGITLDSNNDPIIVGEKSGEFVAPIVVTPETGSGTGVIKILRSAIPNTDAESWDIGGTGITGYEAILYVERYTGLTGTVRQGSGATFDIIDNGNGSYSAAVVNGGTNYLAGHKIKILGTSLGGATPANDITITVQTVNENGVIQGGGVGNTGTAAGTETATYTALSGANFETGSGFEFTLRGSRYSNNYNDYNGLNVDNPGTNYVENDRIVIPGTSLGGTSPTNDLTITVGVNAGGVNTWYNLAGTSQSTTWKLETTTQVDFAGTGSWSIQYPLSQESLLITSGWSRTFGTDANKTDYITAVARDSGNNIIAVGRGNGETSTGNDDDLAIVYKFSSTGTLLWTRKLNDESDDCEAHSVTTIGTDIYVTHENDSGETIISKLDASGTVKWQRITESGNDHRSSIAATADGNLLVVVEDDNNDIDNDAVKVFLLSSAGEVIYKRWLMASTDSTTRLDERRCLAVVGDSFYVSCSYNTNNNQSQFVARLPVDGSGTGEYGSFRYVDVHAEAGLGFGNNNAQDNTNYIVSELDLDGVDNYAGPLAAGEEVYIKSTDTYTTGTGDYRVESYFPSIVVETVRDTDGGSIIFPDGTKQTTSATEWPQTRFFGQKYTVGMKDRGGHILCYDSTDSILLPYNSRVELPIGTVVRVVNTTSSSIAINVEGGGTSMIVAGQGYYSTGYVLPYGLATLLKVARDEWHISGNVDVN